ncbi:MAG: TrkH family potassium uptake protein [Bacteroidales bacterium]|nr:TrkH family potassium uptake protein [Bacteroidales bacterium]
MRRFNYRLLARLTGILLLVMAAAMLAPLAASLYYADGALWPLLLAAATLATIGLLLRNGIGRKATYELHERESFWVTSLVWIAVPLGGALPYLLSGTASFTNAAFESFSGFTTTGSSIIPDPSAIPQSILLWRAITQWIGGLGLILFVVAILKRLNRGALRLYSAEFSGTQQRKLHPHISTSVSRMWQIYTLLTIVLTVLLILAGNGVLDSVCLALSTVSTGGFMTTPLGMSGYSHLTLALLTLFMFLSGINLALLYNLFTFKWRQLKASQEFWVYAAVFLLAAGSSAAAFGVMGNGWPRSIGYSLFHIASTISTCGFYTTPPPAWPFWVSVATFLLILSGAMAGSTGGGIKLRRLMTLFIYLRNYLTRMLHPDVVFTVKIDRKVVPGEYVNKIFGFVFLYICFIIGGAFLLTLCGSGIAEAFCLAAANISNLGPSPLINSLGASLDYALMPTAAKWVLIALMLAGRLEIFALLAIVSPSYWRLRR